jgi:hypothetical protein
MHLPTAQHSEDKYKSSSGNSITSRGMLSGCQTDFRCLKRNLQNEASRLEFHVVSICLQCMRLKLCIFVKLCLSPPRSKLSKKEGGARRGGGQFPEGGRGLIERPSIAVHALSHTNRQAIVNSRQFSSMPLLALTEGRSSQSRWLCVGSLK